MRSIAAGRPTSTARARNSPAADGSPSPARMYGTPEATTRDETAMSEQAAQDPHTGGTEGRHSAAPGTSSATSVPPGTVPASAALVPLSAASRVGAALARHAADLWLHPDRLLYVMWHGKPESMAEHRAYMKSRAWVPPGMDGGAEKAVTGAGLFYHLLIGRPLLAVANTVGGAAVRPLRLLCLLAFVAALIVLLILL